YRWIAGRVGRPRAWRAAANALRNNPLVLVIPCHRVIRSDGRVAGSGFGRRIREYLLRLEGAIPAT
ncbi:MAG TPA: MGMT family protein, partial [Nitrososphaeria archaeon]|nr:MGMT family protein [Nitrososphaeria archaeon]